MGAFGCDSGGMDEMDNNGLYGRGYWCGKQRLLYCRSTFLAAPRVSLSIVSIVSILSILSILSAGRSQGQPYCRQAARCRCQVVPRRCCGTRGGGAHPSGLPQKPIEAWAATAAIICTQSRHQAPLLATPRGSWLIGLIGLIGLIRQSQPKSPVLPTGYPAAAPCRPTGAPHPLWLVLRSLWRRRMQQRRRHYLPAGATRLRADCCAKVFRSQKMPSV